jgi:phosphinothricin acetyltransferase
MRAGDWAQVRAIYLEGIASGDATFETDAPEWNDWDAAHLGHPRLVAREDKLVLGWAALSPVSKRKAYAGVAEVSVYVAQNHRGRGIGRELLEELIRRSEELGIWTIQAVVFPENQATVGLHLGCGFREVGRRERISKLHGAWRDTILFERRSQRIGLD